MDACGKVYASRERIDTAVCGNSHPALRRSVMLELLQVSCGAATAGGHSQIRGGFAFFFTGIPVSDRFAQERQHPVFGRGCAIPVTFHPSLVQLEHTIPVVVHPTCERSRLPQELVGQFVEQAVFKVVLVDPVAQVGLLPVQVSDFARCPVNPQFEQGRAVRHQQEGAAGA